MASPQKDCKPDGCVCVCTCIPDPTKYERYRIFDFAGCLTYIHIRMLKLFKVHVMPRFMDSVVKGHNGVF